MTEGYKITRGVDKVNREKLFPLSNKSIIRGHIFTVSGRILGRTLESILSFGGGYYLVIYCLRFSGGRCSVYLDDYLNADLKRLQTKRR